MKALPTLKIALDVDSSVAASVEFAKFIEMSRSPKLTLFKTGYLVLAISRAKDLYLLPAVL